MPPPPPRRSLRPRRKTVAQLLARAKATATPEETEAFWNAADKDDAPFDANELSDTGEDVIDSDFDAPEVTSDENPTLQQPLTSPSRRRARNRAYVDPARARAGARAPLPPRTRVAKPAGPARSSLRKSTKMASAEAAEKREHRRAAGERRRRRREAIVSTPLKMPSQEELLAEATVTEIANGESLRELLRLEEEKRRVVGPKKRIVGDVVSFRSRGGRSTVSVSKGVDVGEVMLGRG